MDLINPNTKNNNSEEHGHKLWAHLHIISNFELDVESPYKKPNKELYQSKPEKFHTPKMTSDSNIMVRSWKIW